jgi:flagellar basal body-associated protein FliL
VVKDEEEESDESVNSRMVLMYTLITLLITGLLIYVFFFTKSIKISDDSDEF